MQTQATLHPRATLSRPLLLTLGVVVCFSGGLGVSSALHSGERAELMARTATELDAERARVDQLVAAADTAGGTRVAREIALDEREAALVETAEQLTDSAARQEQTAEALERRADELVAEQARLADEALRLAERSERAAAAWARTAGQGEPVALALAPGRWSTSPQPGSSWCAVLVTRTEQPVLDSASAGPVVFDVPDGAVVRTAGCRTPTAAG